MEGHVLRIADTKIASNTKRFEPDWRESKNIKDRGNSGGHLKAEYFYLND